MSKKLAALTAVLGIAMTVGLVALTAVPAAEAGGCIHQTCAECPTAYVTEQGIICEFSGCIVAPTGCKKCQYDCNW